MEIEENRRVLIVDDNEAIHVDFRKVIGHGSGREEALESAAAALFEEPPAMVVTHVGYDIDSAYQGQDALARVQQSVDQGRPYAVVFVDVRMPPGWDGIETVKRIWEVDRDLQVVICTAYSDYSWSEMIRILGETDRLLILKKPFDNIEVRQIASALVAKWNLARKANRTLQELQEMVRERTHELDGSNIMLRKEVAERKRSEEALREIEARTRAIVDTAPDGIITIDEAGLIESHNRATDRMFGYSPNELLGKSIAILIPSLAEGGDQTLVDWPATLNTRLAEGSLTARRRDDQVFPIEIALSELRFKERTLFTAIVRDTSEQKRLESQLIQAQKLESVGQLSAGIAHEINTPTQYVGDNTQFLKDAFHDLIGVFGQFDKLLEAVKQDRVTDEDVRQMEAAIKGSEMSYLLGEIPKAIDQSLDGIDRVASIVSAIRDFSHPGGGAIAPLDLNRAVESTAIVARNVWAGVAELQCDFDLQLPPVPCVAAELNQVILNLIINAANAISEAQDNGSQESGRITLRTRRIGNRVEIQVCDNGIGIAPKNYSRIFEPFFTTKQVGKGTGQGLAIARTIIVKKHQGELTFESALGKGTTFTIRLPLEPSKPPGILAPSRDCG